MMGKCWNKMWKAFDGLMDSIGPAIDEAMDADFDLTEGSVIIKSTDGDVVIRGHLSSLRVNGYRVNLPAKCMKPRK